jgi:hypothetical protein
LEGDSHEASRPGCCHCQAAWVQGA